MQPRHLRLQATLASRGTGLQPRHLRLQAQLAGVQRALAITPAQLAGLPAAQARRTVRNQHFSVQHVSSLELQLKAANEVTTHYLLLTDY